MKHFLYAKCRAPDPPEWFLPDDLALLPGTDPLELKSFAAGKAFVMPLDTPTRGQHCQGDQNHQFNNRLLCVGDQVMPSSYSLTEFLDDRRVQWVREKISEKAQDVRFVFTLPDRDRLGPHSDRSRNFTMIYLLQSGGHRHETVFYSTKSDPNLIKPLGYHVDDYRSLNRIGSIKIPLRTWTLLNARILHSIENIGQSRMAIQISFIDFPDDLNLIDYQSHVVDQ